MPSLMTLEGPRVTPLGEIRSRLYAATPRTVWRAKAQLRGVFDPIKTHWWALGLGLLGGAIFAAKSKK